MINSKSALFRPGYSVLFIPLLLIQMFSCRAPMAGFQPGTREDFGYKIPRKSQKSEEIGIEPIPVSPETITYETELPVVDPGPLFISPPERIKSKYTARRRVAKPVIQKERPVIKEKPGKKKDKKRRPEFNDALKTGTVFLLIAIGLGIFSLGQLSLLFGLVAILFLYFGLKKYYRQQRRRKLFK